MIFIAANILFLLFVFIGIGLLFPWSVWRQARRFEALLMCFWLGWCLAIVFLQIWHFFFPVGLGAFIVLLAAGSAGWWRSRAQVAETVRGWNRTQILVFAGLALIPCGMVANHVLFSSPNSDYHLYHLQTVKWYEQYAIVPGIGNVYHPLAWNCASFLYTAAIDSGWLADRAYYVSNSLPSFVAILQTALGVYGLFTRRPLRLSDLFYAIMLPVVLYQVSTAFVVAYSPDPLIFFLQILLAGQLIALVEDQEETTFHHRSTEMVLLAATGACVKLNFAVFSLLCLLVMVLIGLRRYHYWPWRNLQLWRRWIVLGLLLIIPWMARNVILTGYLLFPSTSISFPVVWKIPLVLAEAATPVVLMWARTINGTIQDTGDLAWFLAWLNAFPFFVKQAFVITLGILALDLLLFIFSARVRRQGRPEDQRSDPAEPSFSWDPGLILALIIVPALIFWFTMGPSYRFSGALFWILLAAALLIGFRLLVKTGLVSRPDVLAYSLVLIIALWQSPNHFSNNLSRRLMFLPTPESILAEQGQSQASLRQFKTSSGLIVYIPPELDEVCWDAPLPCTTEPNFLPGLRELVPGNPQKGYMVELTD